MKEVKVVDILAVNAVDEEAEEDLKEGVIQEHHSSNEAVGEVLNTKVVENVTVLVDNKIVVAKHLANEVVVDKHPT